MTTQTQPPQLQSQQSLSLPPNTFAKLSPHPYLLAHLTSSSSQPVRPSNRAPQTARTPHINTSSLTHTHGSSVVRLGDTTAVCGIRAEILPVSAALNWRADDADLTKTGRDNTEARALDLLVPNVELATGCSPQFLPGQAPGRLVQTLVTRLYSLLCSSGIVVGEDLRIYGVDPTNNDGDEDMIVEEGEDGGAKRKVIGFWTLYIDILFISLDGNPFDVAWTAILSALHDLRLPQAYFSEAHDSIVCDSDPATARKLKLNGLPIPSTYSIFNASRDRRTPGAGSSPTSSDERYWILADPDAFEEGLCEENVTLTVDCSTDTTGDRKTRILGLEKVGGGVVGKEEVGVLLGLAEKRWREWADVLKGS